MLVQHMTYQNDPQSSIFAGYFVHSDKTSCDCHTTRMAGEVARFSEYVRYGISTNQLVKV